MRIYLFLACVAASIVTQAQNLPKELTAQEQLLMPAYRINPPQAAAAIATPPTQQVRTMAEWEEIDGLMVSWTSYPAVLTEIVRNARLETTVYIVTEDSASVKNTLTAAAVPLANIRFVHTPFNSVWCRDYGQWNAYTQEVDSLLLIDWVYNRPRPKDDTVPSALARMLQLPLYQTILPPNDMIHTGGNFMVDGFGTGFSSKLILDENPTKTNAQIDTIKARFMGLNRYIKMQTLPYDGIHHIDMHMKLLDEETLLVGQFPTGISDGPQLEANLLYVLSTFNSVYGTPYRVVRIPMPPSTTGLFPPDGYYRTFTNSVIVNKSILVPTYREEYDTTALRIYRQAKPGYKVVGINVEGMISASGAIHCITKEIGSKNPLLIRHQALRDSALTTARQVVAYMRHRSGIQSAMLYYRTDTTLPWQSVPMTSIGNNNWAGNIPGYPLGTRVYYYVQATSLSGKTQARPMPAPAGYWTYRIADPASVPGVDDQAQLAAAFPNPSRGITCIPIQAPVATNLRLDVLDVTGRVMAAVANKVVASGESLHFVDTQHWPAGAYIIRAQTPGGTQTQQLIVR